jgi:hypothetical protein
MEKASTPRPTTGDAGALNPFTGHPYKRGEARMVPGFRNEPRALLMFILRVLDGKHRQTVQRHLEQFLQFDVHSDTREIDALREQLSSAPVLWDSAVNGMIAATREMADMWIGSGKSGHDWSVDAPADRNVEDVLPGREYSLFQKIDGALFRSYPRYTEMRRDGSLQIKDTYPNFDIDALNGPLGVRDVLEAHGESWAAFYFSRFLNSPDSRYMSRCDHCKRYFAYQRARLRTVKRGVFCPACDGKGSVKRTEVSRARRLDTAAKAWLAWEISHRGPVRTEWVADQVNKAHETAFGRRWINQNLAKIQERVEALRNAKS